MKRLFARIRKNKNISFDESGIIATTSDGQEVLVKWGSVNKIVLLDAFEEYSGYFLTDDYKSKVLYHDISIACKQNIVKVRTGGSPSVKKNISEPFSKNFGTTSIYYPVFVEYVDDLGNKNLYANHYSNKDKEEVVKQLKTFLPKDKVHQKKKVEGFTPLSEL
ncbi:hypothetical protein AXE80_12315 [Wenyingzhuangia fucanilytica]|uniref:Uncharacterized protein n=1 Tax=Wenyingzhuangia fucanilytica TaxID=1790137 RepID=A0A1B1Y8H5_9FLAO|nr:hypothetical protein [Wenyingzhuangia fucanilytica]ANW97018.1 hypothetical protein AXE80_12315 [Wenyingzhuangia fucanilytica]